MPPGWRVLPGSRVTSGVMEWSRPASAREPRACHSGRRTWIRSWRSAGKRRRVATLCARRGDGRWILPSGQRCPSRAGGDGIAGVAGALQVHPVGDFLDLRVNVLWRGVIVSHNVSLLTLPSPLGAGRARLRQERRAPIRSRETKLNPACFGAGSWRKLKRWAEKVESGRGSSRADGAHPVSTRYGNCGNRGGGQRQAGRHHAPSEDELCRRRPARIDEVGVLARGLGPLGLAVTAWSR